MKNIYLFAVLSLLFNELLIAQTPEFEWIKNTGIPVGMPKDMVLDAEGNVYVIGSFQGETITFGDVILTNFGIISDIYVVKYNSDGDVMWAKNFGGNYIDSGHSIALGIDGNLYISGIFRSSQAQFGNIILNNSSSVNNESLFVAKIDADGNIIWAKSAQSNMTEISANGIQSDSQGNTIVIGSYYGNLNFNGTIVTHSSATTTSLFIAKYDIDGNILWVKSNPNMCTGDRIRIDGSDNVFLLGTYTDTSGNESFALDNIVLPGNHGIFLAKYDTNGNALWASTGSGFNDFPKDLAIDTEGNLIVIGMFRYLPMVFETITLENNGGADVFVVKYDSLGNLTWAKSFGGNQEDSGERIAVDTNNNIHISGYLQSQTMVISENIELTNPEPGTRGSFVVKYNSLGNTESGFTFKSSYGGNDNPFQGIATDMDQNIYLTGICSNNSVFGNFTIENAGAFTAKFHYTSLNNQVIANAKPALYPNPVLTTLSINPVKGHDVQSVVIYNALGQHILTFSGFDKGITTIDLSSLTPGYYITEIISEKGKTKYKIIKE